VPGFKRSFAPIAAAAIGPLSLLYPLFGGLLGMAIASGFAIASVARYGALSRSARPRGMQVLLAILSTGPALSGIACVAILALWPPLAPAAFLGASWGLALVATIGFREAARIGRLGKRTRLQFRTLRPRMFSMRKKAGLLIGLVESELDDLKEDVADLETMYRERYEKSEISNYVYLENNAMLEKELKCIERLKGRLGGFGPETAESVEGLAQAIKADFLKELHEDAAPEALGQIVARRIDKALRYCASKE
jgi:hypothetical protein